MPTNSPPGTQIANSPEGVRQKIRVVAIIEATTVNAVAKNVLEFHRAARDLEKLFPDSPTVETSLVTFNRPSHSSSDAGNEFVTAAKALGVEIDVIPERGRFDLRVIPALREIVKRRSPDIVATHQVKSHFLMKVARLNKRYPWVAFHHGYTATDRKMRAYNHLNRWSLPTAQRVVTVCDAFARELGLIGVTAKRLHVQHNAIRPDRTVSSEEAANLRRDLKVADDEYLVLSVGRLSREKGHVDLLAALKHLDEISHSTKARLLFVGDGPERHRLETTASSLGISQRVLFTGEVNDVQPYYAAADVLALPSHSEGSPYVLLEAMAANLPVVATAVGGVPEMVENEQSALLVPASDPKALAIALGRVASEPELVARLNSNAAALTSTRYSPETYAQSIIKIYRDVLAESRTKS